MKDDEWVKENEALYNSFKFEVDKKENLSNGDKVKVTVKYDEDLYDDASIKFSEISKEYEVDNLMIYINEKSKLSSMESKALSDQVMAITYKYFMGKSGEDDYIRSFWSKKRKDPNYFNLIFKVDYEITDMSTYYDYKEKEQLTGTYYVTFYALNLAKRGKEFTYKIENKGFMSDGWIYISNQSDVKKESKTINEVLERNENAIKGKLIKISE